LNPYNEVYVEKEKVMLWALPVPEVFGYLSSSEKGLTDAEARRRLEVYGVNEIVEKERRQGLQIFLSQFTNPLVLVLIVASIIAFFLREPINAIVILSIVFLNSLLGFFQEYRAERALEELKKYVTFKAEVIRNGEMSEVDDKQVVPGDVVHLAIGDIIPADTRLFKVEDMTTNESSLTGESLPVLKNVAPVSKDYSLPQYLTNMAFMGTSVASGSGEGVVIATGKNTFFGETAAYLKQAVHEGDFQKNIRKFSNFLLKVILAMTAFIFIANAVLGKGVFSSFLFALALAVGITPEVLPIIMTITLSNGALRMAKEKVITKRLVSVEDFGNIDTLCCDKTGTLTEGELSLYDYLDVDEQKGDKLILYGLLCSSVEGGKGKKSFGNPMDKAIWENKKAKEIEAEVENYTIIDRNEFDFERRRMSVLVKGGKSNILIVKGAPESILGASDFAMVSGNETKLSNDLVSTIKDKVAGYENGGYRVIALAERYTDQTQTTKDDEKNLILTGFFLFLDPPKKTVRESLNILRRLGVSIKVISGDSPIITRKVCNDVGLGIVENRVITGDEIEQLKDDEFEMYSTEYNVFARVTPEQKYRIVSNLNREGHIVGFLGDGINDAPALRAADVGISVAAAVGIAKEAADIILLKKSLRVLAHGIIEGRKTFGNITKYILNTISANYGNMITVAMSSLFLKFIPLLPSQILLNNFISDVPLLTISTDNVDREFLKRPKRWNIRFISRFMVYFGLISTFFDLALILPLLLIVKVSSEVFRTAWFIESALSEIVVTFAIRTRGPFFKSAPSKWLSITSVAAGIAVITVTYTVFGNKFFQFARMPGPVLALIAGILLAYFITAEITKRFIYRGFQI